MTTDPRGPAGRPRFQLKLALHSTLISSLVLIVSGGLIWHYTEQSHQAQLDRELSDLAFEMVVSGQVDPDRSREGGTQITFYDEELHRIGLLVQDHEHGQRRASPNWPEGLQLSKLPVPLEAKDYEPSRTYSHIVEDSGGDTESHGEHAEHLDRSEHESHRRARAVQPRFVTIRHEDESWRVVGLRPGERTLHVAANLRVYRSNLNDIRNVIFLAVALAMAVSAAGGWWLAQRALQPVRTLTMAAEEITAADLARRIDDDGADREFARLIEVFNGMLERLESSFGQAVRFSADASHELKTPLTIMQGEVETALQSAPEGSAEQVALASQLEEIQRLKHLVRKLLLLSQADSGSLPQPTSVSTSELWSARSARTCASWTRACRLSAACPTASRSWGTRVSSSWCCRTWPPTPSATTVPAAGCAGASNAPATEPFCARPTVPTPSPPTFVSASSTVSTASTPPGRARVRAWA